VLDVPTAPPARQRCDTCGFPADLAVVSADGSLSVACLRDRVTLPTPRSGDRLLERRFGRWCAGRTSVDQLVGSALDLDCEGCGAPGVVAYRLTTADGHWETVACLACLPPRIPDGRVPGSVRQQALARRVRGAWRNAAQSWWPASPSRSTRRRRPG
jgi:hypothetical protein